MNNHNSFIPNNRELTIPEKELILWMLQNGNEKANQYIKEIENISVATKCPCGCASINFAYNGKELSQNNGLDVIADFRYITKNGNECGAFLFLLENHLAGLELWSIDGNEIPNKIPNKEELKKYE